MNTQKLVLASSSKSRNMQLRQMQYPFATFAPNIDETQKPNEDVQDMVVRLAYEKALAAAHSFQNSFIIGADQVQWSNNKIQGKPHTSQRAIEQLTRSSGRTTFFYSGLCVYDSITGNFKTKLITTEVKFKTLTTEEITRYVELDNPLKCAGSIRIEGMAACLIEYIKANDPMAIVGMPLITVAQMLEELGFSFLDPRGQ